MVHFYLPLIECLDIFFKHAGFNDKERSRRQQKLMQVENAERVEVIINSPTGILCRNTLKNIKTVSDFKPV